MNKGIVLGIAFLFIGMGFTGTSYSLSMKRSKTLGFDGNILYVGVGIQPAFAVESRVSVDSTQVEEDCDCQPVSDINLNRFSKITEIKELYDGILTLSEVDMENETICDFLFLWFCIELFVIQGYISFMLEFGFGKLPILKKILEGMYERSQNRMMQIGELMNYFNCEFFPYPIPQILLLTNRSSLMLRADIENR